MVGPRNQWLEIASNGGLSLVMGGMSVERS